MYEHLASTKMSDVLRPQSSGETVNVHVTQYAVEPKPDYEAMRRLVTGEQHPFDPAGFNRKLSYPKVGYA